MTLKNRIHRLERGLSDRNRCPRCRDRAGLVLITSRQEGLDATPVLDESRAKDCEPCLGCGFTPDITHIIETVVNNREEILRVLEADSQTAPGSQTVRHDPQ